MVNRFAAAIARAAKLGYQRTKNAHVDSLSRLSVMGMGDGCVDVLERMSKIPGSNGGDFVDARCVAAAVVGMSHQAAFLRDEGPFTTVRALWDPLEAKPMRPATYMIYVHGMLNTLTNPDPSLPHNIHPDTAARTLEALLNGMVRRGLAPTLSTYNLIIAGARSQQLVNEVMVEMAREELDVHTTATYNAQLYQQAARGALRDRKGATAEDCIAEFRYNDVAIDAATVAIVLRHCVARARAHAEGAPAPVILAVNDVLQMLASHGVAALTPDGLYSLAHVLASLMETELAATQGDTPTTLALLSIIEAQITACERAGTSVPLPVYQRLLRLHAARGDGPAQDALLARATSPAIGFAADALRTPPAAVTDTPSFLSMPFDAIMPQAAPGAKNARD